MKATELRIGNLFPALITGEFVPVKELGEHMANIGGSWVPYSALSPILLTEEWLVKFGFRMHEGNNFYKYWIIGDFITGFELTIRPISDKITFCFTERRKDKRTDFDLQYVHQLQNLYFALTGEELEWK